MVSLANQLQQSRKRHGLSREAFARLVPCSAATIQAIEKRPSGKRQPALQAAIESVLARLDNPMPSAQPDGTAGNLESATVHANQPSFSPTAESADATRDSA